MAEQDQVVQEGKFFAIISYLSFLCMLSLVLKKDNAFALYHGKQGLALFVIEVASFIISVIPLLGWLKSIGFVVFALVSLWGMGKAWQGQYCRIPVISRIADKIIM